MIISNNNGIANDSHTKLLLHMNGANNGTTFTDDSKGGSTHTITRYGAVTKTAVKKFGTASGYFDGDADYLTIPDSDDWYFNNTDHTIDLWFRPTVLDNATRLMFGQSDSSATASSRQSQLILKGGTDILQYAVWDDTTTRHDSDQGTTALVVDTWYHIAVVRNGDEIIIYLDGVQEITFDITGVTMQNATGKFGIGTIGDLPAGTGFLDGYIDEFRISKGIARWNKDFDVPNRES